mmetsp:Transcript_22768/g.49903  ORF Transcript_22768/g.49903 Transcript_22768/m.49903 type:complete len:515 (-) Transcript_22768:942-2486(-)
MCKNPPTKDPLLTEEVIVSASSDMTSNVVEEPTIITLAMPSEEGTQEEPKDRWSLTYAIFFLLGAGILFPWNVLITETAYFNLRFHTPPYPQLVADNFENFLAVCFQLPNLLVLLVIVVYKLENRIPRVFQILAPLFISLGLMTVQLVLTKMDYVAGSTMAEILLPSAALMGGLTSMLNGGCFGLVGGFPSIYTQAVMTGQALAGLMVAVASFITIWAEPPHHGDSLALMSHGAFNYFCAAIAVLALCVAGYFLLHTLPFFKFHHERSEREAEQHARVAAVLAAIDSASEADRGLAAPLLAAEGGGGGFAFPPAQGSPAPSTVDFPMHGGSPCRFSPTKMYRAALMLNFTVTLGVFPGITSMVTSVAPSSASRLTNELFAPLAYVLFNAGDFSGRVLAGLWPHSPPAPGNVLSASAARVALVPLILLCHVDPPGAKTWDAPVLFNSDAAFFCIVAFLGLSNGYIGSLCMMHGPSFAHKPQRASEGVKLALCLIIGCTCGCALSLVASAVGDADW